LPDDEPQCIGRSSESLPLTDLTISRRHAELTPDDGRWYINDLESANGTFVNGKRVKGQLLLQPGDQIRTGATILMFGRDLVPLRSARQHPVRVAKRDEMEVNVEKAVPSADDSMVLAVPEPSAEAVKNLRVIYELIQLIGSIVDDQTLLERMMDVVFEHFDADRGFVMLQKTPDEKPAPIVVRYRVQPQRDEDRQIVVSRTIVQHVMRRGEGVLASNAMSDRRFATGDSVHRLGIRSVLCVPIKFKDKLFGVIHLDSKVANYTYTEDQLLLLTAIGVQTGLALANAERYQKRVQHERLAAIGETVASLSHSIKNIIQGLRGGAEVVDLGLKKQKMQTIEGGWEITKRNLERIYNLTMNMLQYSKQRQPDVEMTNLNKLLGEIVELVQGRFDDKKVALITELDETMPPVPMDSGGVHQAILNLLYNALEAVEEGKGAVSLGATYDAKKEEVELRVGDNGCGMDFQQLMHLFEPFHSTKGQRGTGLGLVVAKKVVDEHGGKITCESGPGQGTVFTITLPTDESQVRTSDETHDPTPRESDSGTWTTARGNGGGE
jgi:signal transduction histidine kinase